ncbi:hypothetical protein [Pandoraea commovens]|uniref:Uncharacterized protein n=1 Tax=Pandoraea commovens TaxID=2508289 RepID=A0A5E4SIP2_9BURK|nr:hypothetical protein [Pandoraea commovens]VVD74883.1 hypothetical protein PCO31010_00822 [Pandoraea commovens]
MNLDREYQKNVLQQLAAIYPARGWANKVSAPSDEIRDANLFYLCEHGLITECMSIAMDNSVSYGTTRITKDGMDFLADDGGLSAVLGVVTIKLHEDTIKSLIEEKILASAKSPAEKQQFVSALRKLPADATKHLTMKLLDLALTRAPDALHAIQTALHQSS